jgi:hypothetical protein
MLSFVLLMILLVAVVLVDANNTNQPLRNMGEWAHIEQEAPTHDD